MGDYHEYLYGDPKRVRQARVQAEGRIAGRFLWAELVESWAVPLVDRLSRLPFFRRGCNGPKLDLSAMQKFSEQFQIEKGE